MPNRSFTVHHIEITDGVLILWQNDTVIDHAFSVSEWVSVSLMKDA